MFLSLEEDDVDVTTDTVQLSKPGAIYKVEKIIPHKDYDKKTKVNDIALVKTSKPIAFSKTVSKIEFDDVTNNGDDVTMSGWGYTVQRPGPTTESPDNLQFLSVKTFDLVKCGKQLPPQFKITEKQVCFNPQYTAANGNHWVATFEKWVVHKHLPLVIRYSLPN